LTYRVFLLASAKQFLKHLSAEDLPQARDLARILLSLQKNPKPEGSRGLNPITTSPVSGGRVWKRPDWTLTYRVDETARTVDVTEIERSK
jgi:mRNA-degrading endonuclease RelE of RelBE toxin-antitoxin system